MLLFRTPAAVRRGLRFFRDFAPVKAAIVFLCASLACAGKGASASTFQINVAATNLTAGTNYGVSFELQNGLLDNPLQARISNFSLTGGTLGDGGSSMGANAAKGSLNDTLSLATTDVFDTSDWIQKFSCQTNSVVMAFTLNLSSSAPQSDALIPDFFRFSFFDSSGTQVATEADDRISLVYAAFDTTSPPVQTFRTSNFNSPNPTGPKVAAQIQPSAAPEPGTLALLLPTSVGGGAVWLHCRRKRILARA